MRTLILGLSALLLFIAPASAEQGPKFGSALELLDQSGTQQNLDGLAGENGTVVVFYRSAKWCPYCQVQLVDLNTNKDQITAKGYNIVGVSYDSVADLQSFATKKSIDFPLLSDNGSQEIRALGIFNEEHKEGSFAYGVPHPTIFILDTYNLVKAQLAEEGYKNRPTVEAILEAIEAE